MFIAPDKLLPADKAGRLLKVDPEWLLAEAAAGRLPYLQAGETVLFAHHALRRELLARASRVPSGEEE